MVPIRFTTLLLGLILAPVALPSFPAAAPQVMVVNAYVSDLLNPKAAVFANQEVTGNINAPVITNRKLMERRKAVEAEEIRKEMMEKDVEKEEATEISGLSKSATEQPSGISRADMYHKKVGYSFKPVAPKCVDNHKKSGGTSRPGKAGADADTDESQKLLSAALDALNMLSRDYNHNPRGKPPINNGQQGSEVNVFNP